MNAIQRFGSPIIFLAVAAGVYATAFYFRSIFSTIDSPRLIAGALVVDLVILVPATYYFLVIRRYGLPVISVAGVFVLSLIAATRIIPSEQQAILTPLEILAGVAELSILSYITWKAVKGIRRYRAAAGEQHDEDAFTAIRKAAHKVIDLKKVAEIFAFEIAILYYGLFSWRRRPAQGPGRYTSYKHNNYGPTLFGLGVILVVELIAVHLVIQAYWSTTAAWILTILSTYAGIWLLSEYQAHRLRPTVITGNALVLRAGIRWELTIPFESIQSFRRISAIEDKPRGTLSLVAFGDAHFEIVTKTPVEARGAYGIRKTTECVWFTIDTSDEFQQMLSTRLSNGETTDLL
jgi:hypothetical protein